MAGINYLEQSVAGTKWRRYGGISVSNPYGGQPMVQIGAEDVALIGDDPVPVVLSRTPIIATFDPDASIPLRNPETGEPLGSSITQGEVYAILYSLCRQLDGAGA